VSVKDVAPEDQAHLVCPDEFPPEEEGLREPLRAWLHDVRDPQAPLGPVLQQGLEPRTFLWRRDDKDVPDPRQHQHRQGVIYHRFVVDGEELLAHHLGDGVKSGPRSTGKDDPLSFYPDPVHAHFCPLMVRSTTCM